MHDIMCQEFSIQANAVLVAARPMTWAQRRQSRMDTSVQGITRSIQRKSPLNGNIKAGKGCTVNKRAVGVKVSQLRLLPARVAPDSWGSSTTAHTCRSNFVHWRRHFPIVKKKWNSFFFVVERNGGPFWWRRVAHFKTNFDDRPWWWLFRVFDFSGLFCFVLKMVCFLSFYSCAVWSSAETGESQDFGCHAVCQRSIGWTFASGRICRRSPVDAIRRQGPHGNVRLYPRQSPSFDDRCSSPAQLHGLPAYSGKHYDLGRPFPGDDMWKESLGRPWVVTMKLQRSLHLFQGPVYKFSISSSSPLNEDL